MGDGVAMRRRQPQGRLVIQWRKVKRTPKNVIWFRPDGELDPDADRLDFLIRNGVLLNTVQPCKKQQSDTWELRCALLLAHVLPKGAYVEWLGDLKEAREELMKKGYPRWAIVFVTLGRVFLLGWSLFRIRYQDLVSAKRKTQEIK